MFFPLTFFAVCLALAILLQIIHHHNINKGRQSLVGRRSTLNLVAEDNPLKKSRRRSLDEKHDDNEEAFGSRRRSIRSWVKRSSIESFQSDVKGDEFGEGNGEEGNSNTRSITGDIENGEPSEDNIDEQVDASRPRVRFEGL